MSTPQPEPGDLGLAHTAGTVARLIRAVERIRRARAGGDPKKVWANHLVIYAGGNQIIQACPTTNPRFPRGVILSPITDFSAYRWSTGKDLGAPGSKIVEEALAMVGTPYALLDVAAFLFVLMGIDPPFIRKRLNRPDRLFCSQAGARAVRLARQSEALEHGVPLAQVLESDLGIVPGTVDSEQTPDDVDRWLGTLPGGTAWSSTT